MNMAQAPGKIALELVLADEPSHLLKTLGPGCTACTGKTGSADVKKILASIETIALREGIVSENIAELHAFYHAAYDCVLGLLKGDLAAGSLMRTVGLRFSVVRSPDCDGRPWVAVAMYGTIGSLMKGKEHEAAGLGVCHA